MPEGGAGQPGAESPPASPPALPLPRDPFGLLAAHRETFRRRYEAGRARIGGAASWAITGGLLLAGIVLAVPAAFIGSLAQLARSLAGGLTLLAVAPLVEELAKALVAFLAVDRRPWWLRHRAQLLLCTVGTGLAFGVIENLIYQHVYFALAVEAKTLTVAQAAATMSFRWPVTTTLHAVTAAASGLWLGAIWSRAERERTPPRVGTGIGWLVAAMGLHLAYNVTALLLESAGAFG